MDLLPADREDSPLTQLIRKYLNEEEVQLVWQAYRYAEQAHAGQTRKTGEPYITHPISVACILAKLHLDLPTLLAALLHDVVEDTEVDSAAIAERFGKQVADLVDGLTKLDKVELQTATQAQAENFRKMLLAMSQDVRVILVKLADRLHNMQTLEAMRPEKQKRIARETLDIYAPIANRLGLNPIYHELEDLSLKYLYPNRFRVIDKAIRLARGNRKEVISKILEAIQNQLKHYQLEYDVAGREKHLYSIYKKMAEKSTKLSQIGDIYGFRVVVKDTAACYLALGALHALYKPIPGRFKDYIAIPKANGYQSLHTTLFGPFGTPIEVQIRSQEMHNIADAGVAAHWLYKTTDAHLTKLQQQTHQWLQRLVEIQTESEDSHEFLENFKVDLFPDEVYVFTPKGNIMALPRGSTAVDFAYAVHSDVGNSCVAVKINNELAPLRTEMRNGDHVEIITAPLAKPNPAWLNYVVTGKARSHIRHYLKTVKVEESAQLGERMLNVALRAMHIEPAEIAEKQWQKVMNDYGTKTRQGILTDIGLGKRNSLMVAHQLLAHPADADDKSSKVLDTITIRGSEGMAVQFAPCCRPIPGDPILGFINKDKGLVIHTHDCPAIRKFRLDPEKWLDVEWDADPKKLFSVNLRITVVDERGMLAKVAATISNADANIDNVSVENSDGSQYSNVNFTVQVHNRVHLATLIRNLRKIQQIVRINRVKGNQVEQRIQ
ncbi:bifunctional (p)ppGpp synthetase/guanosine-3',5'-bis(diphosphate) 3'-pyrophosphohydrolase [Methylophilus medardicus]|uniref:Bifunctional (P)ppGpp synthetase/guanosine-3',5'-bis(Diphosphate) 3'-pyrophosphohydrolase n=1 Tax=Methylophilus medardicus TaxID=2588534 RepID=A0A5B8CVW0_9PROT|nr:bifunctional (p)ppGpp synthetase/guanosine-3',5'-bis(diphosphate) 3'-pyrophosphohydrolase [Methylophilus medardicus]QDC50243.1 bifunctional (p)ppGpp synthetase/guanosine-3',5'-bis(diphosphate) 3'-pyrophosphohydrolase [Methylophilus medardicus]QDC53948.1 bifunctional (p)ppGpp synthetase/guanosine-3',5'-bis(diphosphate) 3'-pyrophosphohydrolase [Methylophilus medardicus]